MLFLKISGKKDGFGGVRRSKSSVVSVEHKNKPPKNGGIFETAG
jgi:hypothetical protein